MKRPIKTILSLAVSISLFIPFSYSVNAETQKNSAINLEQAKVMAVEQSPELEMMGTQIINAQKRLGYATRKAQITDDVWSTDEGRAEVKKTKELVPVQKKNATEVLKLLKEEKIKSINIDVTKQYFTYLLTMEQLENQNNTINRINDKLKAIKAQISVGKANESDLQETEVALQTAEQQKDLLTRDLNNTVLGLNSLLGRSIESEIVLIKQDIPFYKLNVDIDEVIQKRIETSSEILQAKNNEAEAKIEYDIASFTSASEISDDTERAEDKLLNAGYDYKKLLKDTEINVLNEYNNVLNLRDDIEIKQLQVDLLKKQMDKAKVQYDRGLINIISYNNAIQSFEDADIACKKAKLDYFIAAETFKN